LFLVIVSALLVVFQGLEFQPSADELAKLGM
jgi:hypothetical protein